MIRRLVIALTLWCALASAFQQTESDSQQVGKLVDRFFQVIATKDLDAASALWAPDSPSFVAAREDLRQLFAANRIAVAEASVERTAFPASGRARTYVSARIEAFDTVSGLPPEGYGRDRRFFDWVKVGGSWRIARYAPAEAELADALIAADGAAERARLIAASKPMLTPALVRYLSRQAGRAANSGHPQEAVRLAALAIESARMLHDGDALAWADIRSAKVLRGQSDYDQAKRLAQEGLDLFLRAEDRRGEAAAHCAAGSIYLLTADDTLASRELEASLALARKIHDRSAESAALGAFGEFNRLHGQLSTALKSFDDSLRIDRALGDRAGEAASLNNQANVHLMWGQFKIAENLYIQALRIDEDLNDKIGQAIDWGNIGTTQDAGGHPVDARASLEKSLQLHIESADHHGQALTLNNLGLLLVSMVDLSAALERYTESLEVARQFQDKAAQAAATYNRAADLRYLGRFAEARLMAQESLRLDGELKDPVGEAEARGLLAGLDNDAGRFSQALDTFSRILPVFAQRNMKVEEAQTLCNIAATLQELGDAKAEAQYAECLRKQEAAWDSAGQALTRNNLAQFYLAKGDAEKAIEQARKGRSLAQSTGNRLAEAVSTLALADGLQIARKTDESLQAYNDARQLAENAGAPNTIAAAYIGIGSIHSNQGQFNQAVKDCENAVSEVELMRSAVGEPTLQAGFFSHNQKPYHCLINNLLALHLKLDALSAAERARARTLVEIMSRASVNIYRGLSPQDRAELLIRDARVASREAAWRYKQGADRLREFNSARQARDEFERTVYSKAPALAVQRGGAEPVDLAGLKSLLPDNHSALIEYVLEEQGGWIFMVRGSAQDHGEPRLFVRNLAGDRKTIGDLAESYWGRLSKNGAPGPEGRHLYDLLLKPIEAELTGVNSLAIVPDGRLWLVPFAALPDSEGRYVVENHAVYYAPSLTALRAMESTSEARHASLQARLTHGPPPFLLAGDPWLGPSGKAAIPSLEGTFNALPNAASELTGIASVPGVRARLLMGKDATEERLKQDSGNYPVVHFATHAFFDPANPMDSGILLAQPPATKEDGVWEAREIVSQNLEANLITVSACDTARGEILAGEGIVGLSWALFAAGAESSMLTQWGVYDASTPLLMERFYTEWHAGIAGLPPRAKAVALQRAQKWMITRTSYTNPYYWAPFVLIGAPR